MNRWGDPSTTPARAALARLGRIARAAAVLAVFMAPAAAFGQARVGDPGGGNTSADIDSAGSDAGAGLSVAGTVTELMATGANGAPEPDERLTVSLPADDPVLDFVWTSRGGTLIDAKLRNPRYVRDADLAPIPGVPAEKLAAGPIDLVSTWDPSFLPFRVVFRDFSGEATVTRVRRRATGARVAGGRLAPAQGEAELAGLAVNRPVRVGDDVEITSPAALKGLYHVFRVTDSGAVETREPLPVAEAKGVAYEIRRTGPFDELFKAEPTFVRVGGPVGADGEPAGPKPGLPVTYVWPDPQTDRSDLFVEKRFEPSDKPYELGLTIRLHNFGRDDVKLGFGLRLAGWQHPGASKGTMFRKPTNMLAASCYTGESLERESYHSLVGKREDDAPVGAPGTESFPMANGWVGVDTTYFLSAAVPRNMPEAQCLLDAYTFGVISTTIWTPSIEPLRAPDKTCAPDWLPPRPGIASCRSLAARFGATPDMPKRELKSLRRKARLKVEGVADEASRNQAYAHIEEAWDALRGRRQQVFRFSLYVGPKDLDAMRTMEPSLKESLNYGWFGFIAESLHTLLRWFHDLVGHWGVAIILLTILVKLLLLPLTNKSFQSMQKMQKLKPEIDALKEKFGGDREALNRETMALYKRRGANPLTGCLPMFLQMPIWLALYRTIGSSVELFHAPLGLWIQDLSAGDPYFVMPIVLGVLMLAQSHLTTSTATMEGMQAKFMKYGMPVMFSVFMLFLPAGLVLYILVNTTLTIIQNIIIRRRLA